MNVIPFSAEKSVEEDQLDLSEHLHFVSGSQSARYNEYNLLTAFHPIYSLSHMRIVGYECLLRGVDKQQNLISPAVIFNQAKNKSLLFLDKLCHTIHINNFISYNTDNKWIFLNVNPFTLSETEKMARYLEHLIKKKSLNPHSIVIEILEEAVENENQLVEAINLYKNLGCLIAIDDFGAGHSNFERIWRVEPDIVKIDRGLVQRAGSNTKIQHMLRGLVSLLHENRCIVLAEGIENEREGIACIDANVDLVQGFYFSKPYMLGDNTNEKPTNLHNLYQQYDEYTGKHDKYNNDLINYYKNIFTTNAFQGDIRQIAGEMFNLDRVIRMYAITEDGKQNLASIVSPNFSETAFSKLGPLLRAEGATWQHRPYFKKAIQNPGIVQVTRPYLSIPDGKICITLSIYKLDNNNPQVICCDVFWDQ